jgi:hypothetical protein
MLRSWAMISDCAYEIWIIFQLTPTLGAFQIRQGNPGCDAKRPRPEYDRSSKVATSPLLGQQHHQDFVLKRSDSSLYGVRQRAGMFGRLPKSWRVSPILRCPKKRSSRFSLNCNHLIAAMGRQTSPSMVGRVMARLMGREIYHIIAKTTDHQQVGIAKAIFTFEDLVNPGLEFDYRAQARMRSPLSIARSGRRPPSNRKSAS